MANFNSRVVGECLEELPQGQITVNMFKKYPVGCDEDKEKIFCFPFLLDKETISYIENYARVMFIIRGPPSTGKASLSEMITERYSKAVYCCADRFFTNSFSRSERTQQSIKESHVYCTKKVETACKSNAQTIIVQNTHMRKWEMQQYLDFATLYNYTVIMAITLYRFDCTPEALAENNTDGLNIRYFEKRLRQWEDVPPLFTGWFISPDDSLHILNHAINTMESLLSDGKFCRILDAYDMDDIRCYFKPRRVLYCLAGFSKNPHFMKKYYLSDVIQASYGKCFTLTVIGYLISANGIFGVVHLTTDMTQLLLKKQPDKETSRYNMMDMLNLLTINNDPGDGDATFPDKDDLSSKTTLNLVARDAPEKIEASKCCLIDLAREDVSKSDIESIQLEFDKSIQSMVDGNGYLNTEEFSELVSGDDDKIYRLPNEVWFVKSSKIVCLKSIFTGRYV